MTNVLVVCGGESAEREVSLRSGKAVAAALKQAGYTVAMTDTSADDVELLSCDIVFPVLHGVGGEDGSFQKRLEDLDIPFIGSDSKASRLCLDKSLHRDHSVASGFMMADGDIVNAAEYFKHRLSKLPHVLKPINGGSSIDTLIIRDVFDRDETSIRKVFDQYEHLILEELIEGIEVTVGVLGDEALPVIEIIPPSDEEFDFANKYNGKTQELIPPPHVTKKQQKDLQDLALSVHRTAGCKDFSRSDFIVATNGAYYLLETNTIPGMTSASLFPKAAAAAGYTMPEWTKLLIESNSNKKIS